MLLIQKLYKQKNPSFYLFLMSVMLSVLEIYVKVSSIEFKFKQIFCSPMPTSELI